MEIVTPLLKKEEDPYTKGGFCNRIRTNYARSFTSTLAFLYINGGFKVLLSTALKPLLKEKYNLTIN